jgi:phosphopantetheinyl transferase
MTASLWLLAGSVSTLCRTLELERLLSDDERRRVAAFGNAERQAQYTVGRGVLRQLLSSTLGVSARDIALDVQASGRPCLHAQHQSTLSFSISHTRDLVCWALHPTGPIGVDVEPLQRPRDVAVLAQRFFHAKEHAYVAAASSAVDARARFLQCWTLKEAWFKAFSGSQSVVLSDLGFDLDNATKEVTPLQSTSTPRLRLWSSLFGRQAREVDHVLALAWQGGANEELRSWCLDPDTLAPESLRLAAAFQFPRE